MINQRANILSSSPFYSLDDDQFRLTLFEFMNGSVPLILILINKLSLCKDSENGSCEYDTEDSFNNMLAVNQIRLNLKCSSLETGLSLHMNICRISNKFDKLTNFLG